MLWYPCYTTSRRRLVTKQVPLCSYTFEEKYYIVMRLGLSYAKLSAAKASYPLGVTAYSASKLVSYNKLVSFC